MKPINEIPKIRKSIPRAVALSPSVDRLLTDFTKMKQQELPKFNYSAGIEFCIWNFLKDDIEFNNYIKNKHNKEDL